MLSGLLLLWLLFQPSWPECVYHLVFAHCSYSYSRLVFSKDSIFVFTRHVLPFCKAQEVQSLWGPQFYFSKLTDLYMLTISQISVSVAIWSPYWAPHRFSSCPACNPTAQQAWLAIGHYCPQSLPTLSLIPLRYISSGSKTWWLLRAIYCSDILFVTQQVKIVWRSECSAKPLVSHTPS